MDESKDVGFDAEELEASAALSLQDIDGQDWGDPDPEDSYLVQTCTLLRRRPLSELGDEGLRLLVGQQIGLPTLVPMAIAVLDQRPHASGDLYPGALLAAVLRISDEYWDTHGDQRSHVRLIAERIDPRDPAHDGTDLSDAISGFLSAGAADGE